MVSLRERERERLRKRATHGERGRKEGGWS
jgi:hypothetical protein